MENKDVRRGKLIIKFLYAKTPQSVSKMLTKGIGKIYPGKKGKISIEVDDDFAKEQENIKELIDELIDIKTLEEGNKIKQYIEFYNNNCTPSIFINKNQLISKYYFYIDTSLNYKEILTYTIIKFLRNSEQNRKYFRKCAWEECSKYFLSSRNNPKFKFCPDCTSKCKLTKEQQKLAQQKSRQKKNKPKEEKREKNRNEEIKKRFTHMKERGWKDDDIFDTLINDDEYSKDEVVKAIPDMRRLDQPDAKSNMQTEQPMKKEQDIS